MFFMKKRVGVLLVVIFLMVSGCNNRIQYADIEYFPDAEFRGVIGEQFRNNDADLLESDTSETDAGNPNASETDVASPSADDGSVDTVYVEGGSAENGVSTRSDSSQITSSEESEEEEFEDDFTDDLENINALLYLLDTSQYDKIESMVNQYIKDNDPADTDTAYTIRKILKDTKAVSIYKKCVRLPVHGNEFLEDEQWQEADAVKDYFDGYELTGAEFLYQEGRYVISSKHHIIPYVIEGSLVFDIGGMASDGFDSLVIYTEDDTIFENDASTKLDDNDNIVALWIMSTANIYKNYSGEFVDDFVEAIISGSAKMYLEDSRTDKQKSVSISGTDRSALKEMYSLQKANVAILDAIESH